jgi:hypothetical protein
MHPCADHMATCDHCYSCEVLGICCCSTATRSPAVMDAAADDLLAEHLFDAAEQDRVLGLDLVRAFAVDHFNHALGYAPHLEPVELAIAMRCDFMHPTSPQAPKALPVSSPDFYHRHPLEVDHAQS